MANIVIKYTKPVVTFSPRDRQNASVFINPTGFPLNSVANELLYGGSDPLRNEEYKVDINVNEGIINVPGYRRYASGFVVDTNKLAAGESTTFTFNDMPAEAAYYYQETLRLLSMAGITIWNLTVDGVEMDLSERTNGPKPGPAPTPGTKLRVFYSNAASTTPDGTDVAGFSFIETSGGSNNVSITTVGGDYFCFASPMTNPITFIASILLPDTNLIGNYTAIDDVDVDIDGELVPYQILIDPTPQGPADIDFIIKL